MQFEEVILRGLTTDTEYTRQVIPYLKKEYFANKSEQALYLIANNYFQKYHKCATKEVLLIEVEKLNYLNESLYADTIKIVNNLDSQPINSDRGWLVANTEEFVKDRALHLAFQKSLEIYKGSEQKLSKTAIPEIMSEALGVSFDTKLGHDFIENHEDQLEFYHSSVERIPFDIEILNHITNGGIPRKTLSIGIGATHIGKSLTMCALGAGMYMLGANVLYITLEESEAKIRQRIDANLLNIEMDDLLFVDKVAYRKRIEQVKSKTSGKLKIKEYSMGGASASTIRYLLKEYALKEGFVPDIVFIDYLNLCASDLFGDKSNTNSYIKSITEELRAVAQDFEIAIFTCTQFNRTGAKNTDPDMDDVADSFASMFGADFVVVMTAPDELRAKNMMMWKQQKNRYKNMHFKKRFVIGADPLKMRLYDVEESAQPFQDIDTPIFDTSNTGNKLKAERFNSFQYDEE